MADMINCKICGKPYKLCISCDKAKGTYVAWRNYTDTSEHFKIFMTLTDYGLGKITALEAYDIVSKLDIKDYKNWSEPVVVSQMDEIMKAHDIELKSKETKVKKNVVKKSISKTNE